MGFFRPEAVAGLDRWKGILLALGVLIAGVWLTVRGFRSGDLPLSGLGLALGLGASMTTMAFAQRMRLFRRLESWWPAGGRSMVEVDEREIRVFGSEGLAILSLERLERIDIRGSEGLGLCWVLDRSATGRPPVTIPISAIGADQLFDAFAALPEIDLTRLVEVSRTPPGETVTVWRRSGAGARAGSSTLNSARKQEPDGSEP